MKIVLDRHQTDKLGEIITIFKDGDTVGRIRQIGKRAPNCDLRLEWLSWKGKKQTENAVQFPFCDLSYVTVENAKNMIEKFGL